MTAIFSCYDMNAGDIVDGWTLYLFRMDIDASMDLYLVFIIRSIWPIFASRMSAFDKGSFVLWYQRNTYITEYESVVWVTQMYYGILYSW